MQYAIDKYQSVKYYDERGFIQSLLNLRKELKFLSEVLNIAIIPEKDREQYRDLVVNQANIIQNSLEESAKNDHSGKLLSIVKNHRVNNF